MNLLLILLAVVIEFAIFPGAGLRHRRWAHDWYQLVGRTLPAGARNAQGDADDNNAGWPAALVTVLVPLLAVFVVLGIVENLSAWLAAGVSLFILFLTLGPEDLNDEVALSTRAHNLDLDSPKPSFVGEADAVNLGAPIGDIEYGLLRGDLAGMALAAERRWFGPLAWFFVFGPAGAVLYRLTTTLRNDAEASPALLTLAEAVAWVPARITALLLGIAGSLIPVVDKVRSVGLLTWNNSAELVAQSALSAADNGRIHHVIVGSSQVYRLNAMHNLLKRTLNAWLVLFAVLTLLFG